MRTATPKLNSCSYNDAISPAQPQAHYENWHRKDERIKNHLKSTVLGKNKARTTPQGRDGKLRRKEMQKKKIGLISQLGHFWAMA
jgi:hypothetical protein